MFTSAVASAPASPVGGGLLREELVGGAHAIDEEPRHLEVVQVHAEPAQRRAVVRRHGAENLGG